MFIASGEFFVGLFNAWDVNADGTKKLTDFQYFGFFTIVMFVASAIVRRARLLLQRDARISNRN